MNFCSNCGSDAIALTAIKDDDFQRLYCSNCHTIHYQNPNMVVGCLVYWEDKVLLCKRAIEPRYGYWNVPAGYMENGETTDEGAKREVWEEAKATVKIEGLHCVYNLAHVNQVYLLFLAQLQNLDFSKGVESLEVGLFTESEIPWDNIAFTSTSFALQCYFEDKKSSITGKTHLGTFRQ